jgi:nucleoside-triphosphatase THEP1
MGRVENTHPLFSNVILLTGQREIGKTRLLLKLLENLQEKDQRVSGVISPGVFIDGVKIAIELRDLQTGKSQRLADLRQVDSCGVMTDRWVFDSNTLNWGNRLLANAVPCDLLIVDELGPIELERGQGLQYGILAVNSKAYKAAIVVIRPELIQTALILWPGSSLFETTGDIESDLPSFRKMVANLLINNSKSLIL